MLILSLCHLIQMSILKQMKPSKMNQVMIRNSIMIGLLEFMPKKSVLWCMWPLEHDQILHIQYTCWQNSQNHWNPILDCHQMDLLIPQRNMWFLPHIWQTGTHTQYWNLNVLQCWLGIKFGQEVYIQIYVSVKTTPPQPLLKVCKFLN